MVGNGTPPEPIKRSQGFGFNVPNGENLVKDEGQKKIIGWSKNPNEDPINGNYYKVGQRYNGTEDITLYAIWAENTVQIKFNGNGNTGGSMASMNVIYNKSSKLNKNEYVKYGYSFKEWNTKADGTGTIKYQDEANIQITQDTELYAIWEEVVTATLNITNNKLTEGTNITLSGTAPANGIKKVELRMGEGVLYSENVGGSKNYSKTNLGLGNLNQTELQKLPFDKINAVCYVTSETGKVVNSLVEVRNYTIGNDNALQGFARVVNEGNTLTGEKIILLKDIEARWNTDPIGHWNGIREQP